MFTNDQLKEFRVEMADALREFAADHELHVDAGAISYDSNSFTIKITCTQKPKDGKSIEQVDFEKNCATFGFKPEDYGKTFVEGKDTYTFVGFLPKGRKYQALVRKGTAEYKVTIDAVRRGITS